MPTYKVMDKDSGLEVKLTGNTPPSEEELEDIFKEIKQSAEKDRQEKPSGNGGEKEGGTIMAGKNAGNGTAKAVPFLLGGMVAAGVTLLVAKKSRKPRPGPVKRLTSGARDHASATFSKIKSAVKRR